MKHVCAALVAAFSAGAAVAGDIAGSNFTVGTWNGAAYANDQSGQFSHCYVFTSYTNGDAITFTAAPDDTISVFLESPSMTYAGGEKFDGIIVLDVGLPTYTTINVMGPKYVGATFSDVANSSAWFKQARTLRMLGIGKDDAYIVEGIQPALDALLQCVGGYQARAPQQGGGAAPGGSRLPPPLPRP